MATMNVLDAASNVVPVEKPNANGQATMANSRGVVLASDHSPVPVQTSAVSVSASFTRPSDTTAYTIGDVIGPVTTPANLTFTNLLRIAGGSAYLVKAMLTSNNAASTMKVRLYLFDTDPTPIADNSPFTLLYANAANRLGYIDFTNTITEGSGSTAAEALWTGTPLQIVGNASRTIYGVLVAQNAFTPASGSALTVKLSVDQN